MNLKLFSVFFFSICFSVFSQNKKVEKQTAAIVDEGKKLYRSEMASWYGTDIFIEKYADKRKDIGGYFSYVEGDVSKCVFYAKGENPKVIGTVTFDFSYNIENAQVDAQERPLTDAESQLQIIRTKTLKEVNSDTLFVRYQKSDLNLIPMIDNGEKKVYIITGPKENGVMIFGNDYLVTFDEDNNVKSKKRLHKNIMPVEFGGKDSFSGMHSHLSTTGEFITPTDICTLMLYEKFAKWESYYVISKEYVSIWNCKTDSLFVMTTKAWKKMNKNIEKNSEKD